jgi:hypothetical protein
VREAVLKSYRRGRGVQVGGGRIARSSLGGKGPAGRAHAALAWWAQAGRRLPDARHTRELLGFGVGGGQGGVGEEEEEEEEEEAEVYAKWVYVSGAAAEGAAAAEGGLVGSFF